MNVKFRLISEDETNKIKKRKRKKEEEDLSMFHIWEDLIEKYKFNIYIIIIDLHFYNFHHKIS